MQTKTAVALPRDIDADLDAWLKPFLDATGRKSRRKMAPLYVRGLLGSGERKSIQPMAERLGLPGRRAGGGRHRLAQERRPLGRGGASVLRRGGQDGELLGAGVVDPDPGRSPGPGWVA